MLEVPLRASLLAEDTSRAWSRADAEAVRERFRRAHNNTHAIEYVGRVVVGGQPFDVLFDTGSDALVLPSVGCSEPACTSHRRYDPAKSTNATNASTPRVLEYGEGRAAGFERADTVCVAGKCGTVTFVDALVESERPFLSAGFDGVVGLSLPLRRSAPANASLLTALVAAKALPKAQFAVSLAGSDPWLDFEPAVPADTTWVNLSESGYWQFSVQSIRVGDKELSCFPATVGSNVTTFFGKMCCRSVEEFEHEDRCQLTEEVEWRSRFMSAAVLLATYDDGRVAVKMDDGCVQKVPAEWVSDERGCRGGSFQAVVDTGMSLMTAPPALAAELLSALDVPENCTGRSGYQPLSFSAGGRQLALTPDQYMDTVVLPDGVFCWPHVMPMPPTAKGPVVVLGLPFLRAFTTVFDAEKRRLGFARPSGARQAAVRLRGLRGGKSV